MYSTSDFTAKKRNSELDLFRGLLVLAVILGHFAEITHNQSLLTWLGSGLRMPLFMGLAGYLFNLEVARALPLHHLLHKYRRRLILPWLLASIVYLTMTGRVGILTPLSIFIRPQFHLWFVPVLMAYILLAAVSRSSPLALLGIATPFSIAAMYLLGPSHFAALLPALVERRLFIYPIYFFCGLWVARSKSDHWTRRAALVFAPMGVLWWCTLYKSPNLPAEIAAQMMTCVSLVCLLPRVRDMSLSIPGIAGIGRDSLFFYLWHPLAISLGELCRVVGLPGLLLSMSMLFVSRALCRRWHLARIIGLSPDIVPLGMQGDQSARRSDRQMANSIGQLFRTGVLTCAWLLVLSCLTLLMAAIVPVVPWLRIYAFSVVPNHATWFTLVAMAALAVGMIAQKHRATHGTRALIATAGGTALLASAVLANFLYIAQSNGARINMIATLSTRDFSDDAGPDETRIYSKTRGEPLRLDIYRPSRRRIGQKSPVLIFVHGGGFVDGTRNLGAANLRTYADEGLMVISIDYHLARPQRPTWDLATKDVQCALAWVGKHADELGIDISRVALNGASAGGSLVIAAAYSADRVAPDVACGTRLPHVAAVIARAPLVDAKGSWKKEGELRDVQRSYMTLYLGGSPEQFPERYAEVDARHYIGPTNPPTLLLAGAEDPLLPASAVEDFARRSNAAGGRARLILFPYSGHDFNTTYDSVTNQTVRQVVLRFLQENSLWPGPAVSVSTVRAR